MTVNCTKITFYFDNEKIEELSTETFEQSVETGIFFKATDSAGDQCCLTLPSATVNLANCHCVHLQDLKSDNQEKTLCAKIALKCASFVTTLLEADAKNLLAGTAFSNEGFITPIIYFTLSNQAFIFKKNSFCFAQITNI